jgi:gliding motility-associated-like protein
MIKKGILLICLLGQIILMIGQNVFPMTQGIIRSCKGVFEDSGEGQTAGHYDHAEDIIFTICVPGSQSIDWDFKSFCTEMTFDYLKIFAGKDTFGTHLGTYSGTQGPGKFTVSDSCVTFYFHSDQSVSCTGWQADWTSRIVNMPPPVIDSIPNANCEDSEILIKLDKKIRCDSLTSAHFTVNAPNGASVSNVIPVACDSDTLTDRFRVVFNPPLDMNGVYQITTTIRVLDICDSLWTFQIPKSFNVLNCPITVDLGPPDTSICSNQCMLLNPIITGGNPANYTYHWLRGGLTGPGPHWVCPNKDTMFVLEVRDGVSVPGRDTIIIYAREVPVSRSDTSFCRNSSPTQLYAQTLGGIWGGLGMSPTGVFTPSAVAAGVHKMWYRVNGCADTFNITAITITAGANQASCPFESPFAMTGFAPPGGTWSGPNIDANGIFNPESYGNFRVFYHWNGCQAAKWVYVDTINISNFDTTCLTTPEYLLSFSPPGGRWSGPGITQTVLGRFNPAIAGPGDKTLIYVLNGCRDTLRMHVVDINAGPDQTVCPTGGEITLNPPPTSGGKWISSRITDETLGIYDPASLASGRIDTLQYAIASCTDTRRIFSIQTNINRDSFSLCPKVPFADLVPPLISAIPAGGNWYGDNFVAPRFNALSAGTGFHKVFYSNNLCTDSIIMEVLPTYNIQSDTLFCFSDNPQRFYTSDSGGRWSGIGIIDTDSGWFNPLIAGLGTKNVYYQTARNCRDTFSVTVTPLPTVSINKSVAVYCIKDSLFPLIAIPDTGVFSGNGIVGRNFNPRLVDGTQSKIYYTIGTGQCENKDSHTLFLRPELSVNIIADKDSVCKFDNALLDARAIGGDSFAYQYKWSEEPSGMRSKYIYPEFTKTYFVEVNDKCSDNAFDTIEVYVHPLPEFESETSIALCPGEIGYIKLRGLNNSNLEFKWQTSPERITDSLVALVGNTYRFTATDKITGCQKDSNIYLPVNPSVNAGFAVNLNTRCVSPLYEFLPLTDLSLGAVSGEWFLNHSFFSNYDIANPPLLPLIMLDDSMHIKLRVRNEFGCSDSMEAAYCINDTVYIYVPNAFSPNNDGTNDYFECSISNVRKFNVEIFNRWGEMMFRSEDPNFKWDGTFQGKLCPQGYYFYKIHYSSGGYFKGSQKGEIYLVR